MTLRNYVIFEKWMFSPLLVVLGTLSLGDHFDPYSTLVLDVVA
ncbi:hypothetical protein IMCC12053_973 [Celeribacter marinus]|uniref:Uncharacterized protein n=1 Tax=Celeribacter marinus TaxID=1397108 RepID=A0A0P0A8U4_9RHOB|nr:hypothetical protein IMCC12053_973 [Celeribacter marinus]